MFGEELASLQASLQMDNALVNLIGAPTKSNSSLVLPPSSHPFGLFGSAVFGPGLPGELGTESSDDLITPANAEVPFNGAQLPLPAAASLPPPRQQQCLFCAGLGSQGVCGPLRPVTIDGEAAAVHQLCAMWAPGCYLPQVRPDDGSWRWLQEFVPARSCSEVLLAAQLIPTHICMASRARRPLSTWMRRQGAPGSARAPPAASEAPPSPAHTRGESPCCSGLLFLPVPAARELCRAAGTGDATLHCSNSPSAYHSHPRRRHRRRCRCAYHLPCALAAPNVLLENESYELWCPHHSDADNSDEDCAFTVPRPRRQTGKVVEGGAATQHTGMQSFLPMLICCRHPHGKQAGKLCPANQT